MIKVLFKTLLALLQRLVGKLNSSPRIKKIGLCANSLLLLNVIRVNDL